MHLDRSLTYALFAATCHVLIQLQMESASAQEAVPPRDPSREIYILYKNADDPENRTMTIASAGGSAESFPFLPFAVQPASIADFVAINHKCSPSTSEPERELDMGREGTYVRLDFDISGDQWAMVPFTPDGRSPSTDLAIDLQKLLFLSDQKPVYMMLDARTAAGKTANVEFRVGQGPGDSQRYPVVKRVGLTPKWEPVVIDLTARANRRPKINLTKLVIPLSVKIVAADNLGSSNRTEDGVVVCIDNVRFQVLREPLR